VSTYVAIMVLFVGFSCALWTTEFSTVSDVVWRRTWARSKHLS